MVRRVIISDLFQIGDDDFTQIRTYKPDPQDADTRPPLPSGGSGIFGPGTSSERGGKPGGAKG